MLYDPLLVRYLAAELDARLRGRSCAGGLVFPGDRRALLPLDRGEALELDLHPTRGWVRLVPWEEEDPLEALLLEVDAPEDERLLRISLDLPDRFRPERRSAVVELQTNQWNAVLVGGDGRIVSLAWTRSAGGRLLRSGESYTPPAAAPRFGAGAVTEEEAWTRWREVLGPLPPAERRAALLGSFAYTGTPNAGFLIEGADCSDHPAELRSAFERWWWLRSLPPASPVLLPVGRRLIPYPFPVDQGGSEPIPSLLDGMARLAELRAEERERVDPGEVVARARAKRAAAARRVERLEEELAGTEAADALRASADLLLAKLHEVPRGASVATLEDWEGNAVSLDLDPALTGPENAARLYEEARRRERGAARLQRLLEEARARLASWDEAVEAIEAGEMPDWAERELSRKEARRAEAEAEPVLPYRVYRTSGGLEVRVGKSARGNDDLTFRHAAPNEVWLHARSVPGSHVILRWSDADAAPPARDLGEAATLAALFSRARSSGLVPVDWTRRKYVRKPRGAAPGAVIPQRVKTLFVEPDPELPDRLRAD